MYFSSSLPSFSSFSLFSTSPLLFLFSLLFIYILITCMSERLKLNENSHSEVSWMNTKQQKVHTFYFHKQFDSLSKSTNSEKICCRLLLVQDSAKWHLFRDYMYLTIGCAQQLASLPSSSFWNCKQPKTEQWERFVNETNLMVPSQGRLDYSWGGRIRHFSLQSQNFLWVMWPVN